MSLLSYRQQLGQGELSPTASRRPRRTLLRSARPISYTQLMSAGQQWFLYKAADKEVFGPIPMDQLQAWAAEAKISPHDRLSSDAKQSWLRAAMVPELQMDWLIEMPDKYLYGPTSVGTIQEFLATGEINGEVIVINTLDGSASQLSELPFYQASPQRIRTAQTTLRGALWPSELEQTAEHNLAARIVILERQVMELQHDLGMAEHYHEVLRRQFREATGRDPA